MDNPDTLIELHRTVVQEMFEGRFPPKSIPPQPFEAVVIEGEAQLHVAVSRVWFHHDAGGRLWQQRDGAATRDVDRHFAFDLRLDQHPPELELPNSRFLFTRVLGLPIPPLPATSCNGRQVLFNEIPLLGRLVIHDSLERVEATIDGRPHQNVVLEFAEQSGPVLEAGPPEPGFDAEMFGPDVQQASGGRVVLTGVEPHVVWELTPAEQDCIRDSTVGGLLMQAGIDPIGLVASELAAGVRATLLTSGDDATSRASLLPKPHPVDPTGASGDPLAVDGIVRRWTRQGEGPGPEESLQIQIQTVDVLPEPLPLSVLASSTDETVGFMRAGFAILRSIRASQIRSLCLDASDFDPLEGCLLRESVGIELDGEDATLVDFSATIEPAAELGHDLLHIRGRAEGDHWHYGWYVEFGLAFRLDRGDVPRDPLPGELPPDLQPSRTLAEMHARLRELAAEKCAGGDREAIDEEVGAIADEKNALPREIGVKPETFGEPFQDSDAWITPLGALAGIALISLAFIGGLGIVAAISTKVAFTAYAVCAVFIVGYSLGWIGLGLLDHFVLDAEVSDKLANFVREKSEQEGDALPLEGYSPTSVELRDGVLRVFLGPLARKLSVRFFEPDQPSPFGDSDFVSQQVAGFMADGRRMWRLTVADAAHLIERGRITMALDPSATPGGQAVPIHVARSSRGRRYLRTPGDDEITNNLASLPRIPSP